MATADPPRSASSRRQAAEPIEPAEPVEPDAGEGTIRSGKLAGRSLPSAILILALPVFVEQLANAMVGFVDQVLAGRLPEDIVSPALDAISIAAYVDWFIGLAMATVGIGSGAIIARAIGAGDRELAHAALRQAVIFSVLWGILVGIVLWICAPALAWMTSLSDEAAGYCVAYIRIQAYGLPLMGILMVSIMSLHGAGESVRPFLVMLAVNAVNMVASFALSGASLSFLENPFDLDMHVNGIALGTVIGKAVGALLILVIMRIGVRDLRLEGPLRPRLDMIRRIGRIGLPGFGEGLVMWTGNFAVLAVVGWVGREMGQKEGLLGAHIIAIRWESFSFLPGYAMGVAAGALAGQYLGAGNPRRARQAILACVAIAAVFMQVVGGAFMIWGEPLTRVISDEPLHLELVPRLLWVVGFVQIFFAMAMVIRNGLRGVGDTRVVFVITFVSLYIIRLPATIIAGPLLGFGLVGIWVANAGELVIRAGLNGARYWHGGWARVQV